MRDQVMRFRKLGLAGSMVALCSAVCAVSGQQTQPARGRANTPVPDPRIQMMQGQGRGMDLTDAANRAPQMRGNIERMPGVEELRRQDGFTDVDPAKCRACHDRPPIPIGSHDDPASGFDGPSLNRRSWAAWWEVNREPYLRKARAARDNPIQPLTAGQDIVSALVNATQSESPQLRGEAVLALGRIRADRGLDAMKKLTKDPDQSCALRAWAAIGLLDSEGSGQFLATAPPADGFDRIGWTIAVGLLSRPSNAMWDTLRGQIKQDDSSLEAKRLAIWALRTHHPRGTHQLLLDVINNSKSRELVAEAFSGLPEEPDHNDIKFLAEFAAGTGRTMELASLSDFRVNRALMMNGSPDSGYYSPPDEIPDPFESEGERLARQNNMGPVAGRPDPMLMAARDDFLFMREAAVRVLGDYNIVDSESRKAVANPLFVGIQRTRRMFLPQDALMIGKVGTLEDYYPLSDRMAVSLEPHPNFPKPLPQDRPRRPGRGIAAIAIGLLLDKLGGVPQVVPEMVMTQAEFPSRRGLPRLPPSPTPRSAARPGGRSSLPRNTFAATQSPVFLVPRSAPDLELLMHLQTATEPSELRSACAMALGLGGQDQRGGDLKRVVGSLNAGDAPLFGYSMLALGLMGDAELLPLSARQLGPMRPSLDAKALAAMHTNRTVPPMPLGQVLGRRGIAQGMAVLGDPRAIPILISQWGHNPAVDIEIARAIAWCHRDLPQTSGTTVPGYANEFGEDLASLLRDDVPPALAASAAASLGALFDNGAAQRLDTIIAGQSSLTRGTESDASGKMDLKQALQRQVLALGNPHYYLTAFAAEGRR